MGRRVPDFLSPLDVLSRADVRGALEAEIDGGRSLHEQSHGESFMSLFANRIEEIDYRDTKHFRITRDFLNGPERFFKHLFES